MPDQSRDHDVVVHGGTGFVGRLTAAHLRDHAPRDLRIALSGRDQERLAAVRAELGPAAADWPLIAADNMAGDDMAALAASTQVVATTVGPYHRLGLPLVRACADAGTHYADITGEVVFMRQSIDVADEPARASGARIVHACGFDSVPSDVATFLLAQHARDHDLGTLGDTTLVVRAMRGGVSGGTIDTLRTTVDLARRDRDARRIVLDPHALSPDLAREPDLGPERDAVGVEFDPALGGWLAPFVMATVNTRVVRRSNALLGHAYGDTLRYRERMLAGGLPLGPAKAVAIAGGIGTLAAGLAFGPTRRVLDRILPDPGEGPSTDTIERGFVRIDVHTTTTTGARLRCEVRLPGDPGHGATSVMLGEATLALAGDPEVLPERAGVLTPVTGIGTELVRRLAAAGHRYEVLAA